MAYNLTSFLKGLLIRDPVDTTKQLALTVSSSATTNTTTTITASQTTDSDLALPNVASDTLTANNAAQTLTNKLIDGDDNTVQDLALTSLKTNLSDANNFLVRDGSGNVVSNTKAVPAGAVVGTSDAQVLTNKTIDADLNTLSNIENADIKAAAAIAVNKLAALTASRAVATDGSGFISPSATTSTELGYVSGVTSSIQAQLNAKPSQTGSYTDNHVIRADGTASTQDSLVIIDDSGNVTNVTSMTLSGGGLTVGTPSVNAIQSNSNSSLNLTTNLNTQGIVIDRKVTMLSPLGGLPAKLIMREDSDFGTNDVTIQPAALAANRVLTLPDATTTVVGTDATQTLSSKTFSDAVTHAQVATPANPSAGFDKLYFKSDNILYSLSSAGVETAIGAPSLTNPMTTGGDIIYGGVSGTPTRLANGSSGQVLRSSGGTSAPTWAVPSAQPGWVEQVVNTMSSAVSSGTTQIPYDDTIPQQTEGDQYMSLAITPISSTNKLKIEVVINLANSSSNSQVTAALFQDSTANALAAAMTVMSTSAGGGQIVFTHYMTSGTTSSTTFKVRAGPASAITTTFNGLSATRKFGGVMASSITITEIRV